MDYRGGGGAKIILVQSQSTPLQTGGLNYHTYDTHFSGNFQGQEAIRSKSCVSSVAPMHVCVQIGLKKMMDFVRF